MDADDLVAHGIYLDNTDFELRQRALARLEAHGCTGRVHFEVPEDRRARARLARTLGFQVRPPHFYLVVTCWDPYLDKWGHPNPAIALSHTIDTRAFDEARDKDLVPRVNLMCNQLVRRIAEERTIWRPSLEDADYG